MPRGSRNSMEMVFEAIKDELIEDVMLDACFRAHRAVKLGYFGVDEHILNEGEFEIYDPNVRDYSAVEVSKEIFGHVKNDKLIKVFCPRCCTKVGSTKFASHLHTCINKGGRSARTNKRNLKICSNEDDSGSDDFMKANKKKARKKTKKGGKSMQMRRNIESLVSSSSDANSSASNLLDLSYEKRKEFLGKFCGVTSKRTGRPCMNTLNCSQHDNGQKHAIRQPYSKGVVQFEHDTTETPESSVAPSLNSRSSSPAESSICTSSTSGQSGPWQEEESVSAHTSEC